MAEERVERRLTAILAADVAGYSRLMGADEEGTLAALKTLRREVADPKIKEHRGRIVNTTGDGLLGEFASVVDAVRCAVEVQREMAARNTGVQPERRIDFRIGVNLGDIILDDNDIFAVGVNFALEADAPSLRAAAPMIVSVLPDLSVVSSFACDPVSVPMNSQFDCNASNASLSSARAEVATL